MRSVQTIRDNNYYEYNVNVAERSDSFERNRQSRDAVPHEDGINSDALDSRLRPRASGIRHQATPPPRCYGLNIIESTIRTFHFLVSLTAIETIEASVETRIPIEATRRVTSAAPP